MKIEEFIIDRIKHIQKEITNIDIKYAFEKSTSYHIVEISPENIRRGLDEYIDMEALFWADFFNKFPTENLLIAEVDEDNDMSNLIYDTGSTIVDVITYKNIPNNYKTCSVGLYTVNFSMINEISLAS